MDTLFSVLWTPARWRQQLFLRTSVADYLYVCPLETISILETSPLMAVNQLELFSEVTSE